MSVTEKIRAILAARHSALPALERRAQSVRALITLGEQTVAGLRELAATGEGEADFARQFGAESFSEIFSESLSALEVAIARLQRDTINIGVSGQARMGKSTLLQSVTGLGEEQIPTGSGLPVTAVRSRIFHVTSRPEALLRLHTWESFRREILLPYYRELDMYDPPATLEEFRRPRDVPAAKGTPEKPSQVAIRRRLGEIQAAVDSFGPWLRGTEERIPIDQMRQFVAYPAAEQQDRADVARPYLAVRDVLIFTEFPRAQMAHLGLIDLPGLGELTPDAERHHVDRLRNEVDLVLLVKRPVESSAFWKAEDSRALDLLDEARGAVERSQFVMLVVNDSGESSALRDALIGDIRRQVNGGVDGRNFHVLTCDVSDPVAVHDTLIDRVLNHLSSHLPEMDRAVLRDAEEKLRRGVQRVGQQIETLERFSRSAVIGARHDAVERAEQLHKDLASALEELLERLFKAARQVSEDVPFVNAVDERKRDALAWVVNGFGRGSEVWKEDARKAILRDKNSLPHASRELNRIRVEISHRFAGLDIYLQECTDQAFCDVADALDRAFNTSMVQGDGRARLERFRELLTHADEPLPALEGTVVDLLQLKFAYRAQIHPRVRRALDGLNVEVVDPQTGERQTQVQPVTPDSKGLESLYQQLQDLAAQAVHFTRKAIVGEAMLPALVLHSAVEQFTDALLRSTESAREIRLLVVACEEELWPGATDELRRRGALSGALRKTQRALAEQIKALQGELAT